MSKSLPPLTWFRAFDSAARHLNFTAAAEELGLTQSAVSQHIRSLETRLGAPLFLRKPRGLALTDDGRRLVPDVAAAMVRLQAAADSFGPAKGPGLVTIATSVSLAQYYLAPGLADLHRAHPGLRVRIVTTVWPDDFAASSADIELKFGTAEVAGAGQATLLGSRRLIAVGPADLPGKGWDDWLQAPLIQPVGIALTWARYLRRLDPDLVAPEPAFFVDSHGLAVDLACGGAGVALTNAMVAAPMIAAGQVRQLPGPDVTGDEGYFVTTKPGVADDGVRLILEWLKGRAAHNMQVLHPAEPRDTSL